MAGDLFGAFGKMLGGARRKTEEALARREAEMARGKIAAVPVTDDTGALIVDAGHVIDDAVIEHAVTAGKIHAVLSAALKAQAQDLREKAAERLDRLPEAHEASSLADADDYAAARRYVRRPVGMDVSDIQGNVLVPEGKELTDDDVRAVREAGQLGALIYAMQQTPDPAKVAEHEAARTQSTYIVGTVRPLDGQAPRPLGAPAEEPPGRPS